MQIIFQRENGNYAEALLLLAGRDRMRVVLRRTADTVEFSSVAGHWRDERGRPIEISGIVSVDADVVGSIAPRAMTA